METLKIPRFENENEEEEWLYAHREALADGFLRAAKEGQVQQATLKRRGITPATTIRLAPEDISRARTLAERRGLRYQTFLKMLIHEALEREERVTS
jgi:predicted DNA binding CopG/RHH family protein